MVYIMSDSDEDVMIIIKKEINTFKKDFNMLEDLLNKLPSYANEIYNEYVDIEEGIELTGYDIFDNLNLEFLKQMDVVDDAKSYIGDILKKLLIKKINCNCFVDDEKYKTLCEKNKTIENNGTSDGEKCINKNYTLSLYNCYRGKWETEYLYFCRKVNAISYAVEIVMNGCYGDADKTCCINVDDRDGNTLYHFGPEI